MKSAQSALLQFSAVLMLALLASSCGNSTEKPAATPAPEAKPAATSADHGGLQDQPMTVPADNPITPEKVALGKQLFFDTRLSKTGKLSCESCHHPENDWTSGKAITAKFDGSMNTRSTPTLSNVGYLQAWYWDGRGKTLEDVATAAWKGQMGGDPDQVAMKLNEIPGYKDEFQKAMGGPATGDAIAKALATFMRTIKSEDSPWDRYQAGDKSAVSEDVVKGFDVFSHQNKATCTLCHLPPLFTDGLFHNVGIGTDKPMPDKGRGKILEDEAKKAGTKDDKAAEMMGAFKTPTLRGAVDGAPYFHDGRAKTIEEAIDIMWKGGIKNDNLDPKLKRRTLSPKDLTQLVAFIKSLTPEKKPFEKPTLP
jgi:cytochrome c peroxidase